MSSPEFEDKVLRVLGRIEGKVEAGQDALAEHSTQDQARFDEIHKDLGRMQGSRAEARRVSAKWAAALTAALVGAVEAAKAWFGSS